MVGFSGQARHRKVSASNQTECQPNGAAALGQRSRPCIARSSVARPGSPVLEIGQSRRRGYGDGKGLRKIGRRAAAIAHGQREIVNRWVAGPRAEPKGGPQSLPLVAFRLSPAGRVPLVILGRYRESPPLVTAIGLVVCRNPVCTVGQRRCGELWLQVDGDHRGLHGGRTDHHAPPMWL